MVAVAVLAVAAGVTVPWWWPAVLRSVGPHWGIHIGDWETHGWSSVVLRDVSYERPGLRVHADRAEVPAFGRGPAASDRPAVTATGVRVVTTPVPRPAGSPPPPRATTPAILDSVLKVWPTLQKWVSSARVENLSLAAGTTPVAVPTLTWDGRRLQAEVSWPGRLDAATVVVRRDDPDRLHVVASVPAWRATADLVAQRSPGGAEFEASAEWRGNAARATARFGADDLLPAEAALTVPEFQVAAGDLGLRGYQPVSGSLRATWGGTSYELVANAHAAPQDENASLPPLDADLRAGGDFTRVHVAAAQLRLAGLDATLSAPLELDLRSGEPASPASFAIAADLAQLPWPGATGRVEGRIDISGGPGQAPSAQFTLTGSDVTWRDAAAASVDLAGSWTPERLTITRGAAQLGDDSSVELHAEVDLAQQAIVAAQASAAVTAATLQSWVPGVPDFAALSVEARAEGPWAAPAHAGTLQVSDLAGLPGGALSGEVQWSGQGLTDAAVTGRATSAAGITVPLEAVVTRDAQGDFAVALRRLAWSDGSGEWWHLAEPTQVRFGRVAGVAGWRASVEKLELAGTDMSASVDADVQWPGRGRLSASVRELAGARLTAFLPPAAADARIEAFDVQADWDHGPVAVSGSLRATYAPDEANAYAVEAQYRTDADDLAFGALRILDDSGAVLEGQGRLPLVLAGADDGLHVTLPSDGPVRLSLHSTPNTRFWQSITQRTGWGIEEPTLSAELSGTLQAPQGTVTFGAARLDAPAALLGNAQLPTLTDIALSAVTDAGGVALSQGWMRVDGNWVSLQAHAPWTLWQTWRESHQLAWQQVEFSFAADRLPMTVASRAAPTLFAPEGDVSFKLAHDPGTGFAGFLWLSGAALHPIAPVGAVRDIRGSLLLDNYTVDLSRLEALIGGRPITISGRGDIARLEHPTFDVAVASSRVPLVRQEGMVLRAGLDLRVVQTSDRPAHISGSVDLGQSVFVSDLTAFLPSSGGVAAPEQRPPYFSVREDPFAAWTLDVAVRGDEFLRVENPFFRGTISADVQLSGTLAEPRAVGRAWVDRGTILFPFGNLQVQQAEVSLREEDPYQPALLGSASTRLYGYDVHLAISGTAAEPRLLFSSEPPLSSQSLFLMLTTGELPDTGQTFSSSTRAQRLALFVGRNLASTFGLGGGTSDGEPRLVVRSGEDFSREGGETIYVQYNLNGRWSLVAEKDRFDAVNGGIKFRIIDR